ncbi:MAG: dihydroorotase [Gammaproteobacteria bacterium]|nr:dihydroorotase [Gammaproteobacteria bacterium]
MNGLVIQGGHVVDPANGVDAARDVFISRGKIAAVGRKPRGLTVSRRIDARGLLVLPGIIDLCARFPPPGAPGAPGNSQRAGFESEARAAVAGGITRMVCPPDTTPVVDTPAMVRMLCERAGAGNATGLARVHPLGALTVNLDGARLTDMALLMDAGCVGLSNGLRAVENTLVMRRAMQYASTYDLTVFVTPRDPWLHGNGVVHEGEVSARLGLPAIPEAAETVGVARDLALIETSGARAHFHLLSSARAVEMVAEARARGLPVTASVAIHHLHLNEIHIGAFDARYKVFPPLRTARDQRALVRGVGGGVISAICSDHQPHGADAKLAPFAEAAPGVAGLDTLLTKTMQLVAQGALPRATAVAALTANPAAVIGVDAGHLGPGAPADVCLFDPSAEWQMTAPAMQSEGKNSPWRNQTMTGRVTGACVDGKYKSREELG